VREREKEKERERKRKKEKERERKRKLNSRRHVSKKFKREKKDFYERIY
jgi:hypothetical protein